MFLDENFSGPKVERIKYLADLLKQIRRLDLKHIHDGKITDLGLNPIGVHLIDYELENKY